MCVLIALVCELCMHFVLICLTSPLSATTNQCKFFTLQIGVSITQSASSALIYVNQHAPTKVCFKMYKIAFQNSLLIYPVHGVFMCQYAEIDPVHSI